MTEFGVLHDRGYLDLLAEAAMSAIADAGVAKEDVGAAWLGTADPGITALVGDAGAAVTEAIGFGNKPVTRVSTYCCTGMDAVRSGALDVAAGEHELVLVVGVEKMRDVSPRGSLIARVANQTHPTLGKGRTAPGHFALVANRYMAEYGYTRKELAGVAIKNHHNAIKNPIAHYRSEITEEQVLNAPEIASPLGLLDCTPTTDGAAAVVLASREWAEASGRPYAVIDAISLAMVGGYYSGYFIRDHDYLGFEATRRAAEMAYETAGISDPRAELDLAEVHDCFTITELVNYEDLGFCDRGEGGRLLAEGVTAVDGDLPVNVSGGLQACGHPIGATGARVIAEVSNQVIGRAGDRQVEGARRGLGHTLGGPGVASSVAIISRGRGLG
jgi:acetyl-CoA C-acetyltransferase